MLNKFLFLQFFIYILCNIIGINNSKLDSYDDSYDNLHFRLNIQIPIKRIFIDINNNIFFTN